MTATQQTPAWWREEFRLLDELPLLPCGWGADCKAPMVTDWPNQWFSLQQVLNFDGLRCIGMRCGPDAGGLLVLDFDGPSAIHVAAERFGHLANNSKTWTIGRDNNQSRFKAVYRVPQERWSQCTGKTVLKTADGEQLEFFFGSGQVLVAGEHVKSGGHYSWLTGNPDTIQPVPDEVWAMYQTAISECSSPAPTNSRKTHGLRADGWEDCIPCPICGRKEPDCRISSDGQAILCHIGKRWAPPKLELREKIERNGNSWIYSGDKTTAVGEAALFRLDVSQHELRKQKTVKAGEALARMTDELGDTPMLNVRSQGIHCKGREFTADEVENLYLYLSRGELNWPKRLTADTFITLGADTPFDPVQIYIGNLKAKPLPNEQWERLDQWLFNIDDAITARFMQRFAVAAIARVFQPGCLVRQVPVLLGAQGIGKTQLGRALFSDQWYGDGISSRMDVDDVTLMALCWGVEFAEFDGFTRKTSAERLKAFISRTTDLCRRKYGKGTERIPRRSVFWGTANRSPLVDRTGSTRFCLIPLGEEMLPYERVRLGRDAFWARALAAYRDGFQWFSTESELDEIVSRNAGYDMPDPWEELIRDIVLRRSGAAYIELQDVYRELDIGAERWNGQNAKRITELMADLGWRKARRRIDGQRVNAFFPPSTSGQGDQGT